MVTIKNPISAWLNEGKQKALEAEAKAKIRITDYTNSKGVTFTALVVDGIFVEQVKSDNISEIESRLLSLRSEYISKHLV
nr:MAG TPA: hypothetical protein [Bacteriophage sp.]